MKTPITVSEVPEQPGACFEIDHRQPNWWAPVWQGLVLDRQGRHYRSMGSAVWLFAYCILCADRRTGSLIRKTATISRHMGVKERTIRAWLLVLRQAGYIETVNTGRSLLIRIQKWKTYPQWHGHDRQNDASLPARVSELCQSEATKKERISAQISQEAAKAGEPNDITIKKNILNDNVEDLPRSAAKEDELAWEICQALHDEGNLSLYQAYLSKYPKEIIQQAFKETIRIPANKIKKTKGALFNYLVQHYAKKQQWNHHFSH